VTTLIGLAFGVLILVVFIEFVGLNELVRVLEQTSPSLIIVMVMLELLGFSCYATAWYFLIRATGHTIKFITCQGIAFASIFAGMTMPSGIFLEATRCILGSKESGMKLGESTATVVLHRILYVAGFLMCTALAISLLIVQGTVRSSALYELAVIPIVSIIGLFLLLAVSLSPRKLRPLLDRVVRLVEPLIKLVQKEVHMAGKTDQFLDEYHVGFRKMLSSRKQMAASFIASLGDWGCSVLILWIAVLALGVTVSLWAIVVTIAIGKMIQMTPIAVPGMLGIYETAITATLSIFSIPVPVAASAALLLRVVTTWLDLPVTGIAAYHYGFKLIRK
jgi:uncharacterized protein (TIRG00374 family)